MTEFTTGADRTPAGPLGAEQARADISDLQAAIGDLAGLVAGSLGLSELLTEVATFAVHAIPGAEGAGVTLLRVDRIDNMVEALAASAPFVAEIDEIQYVTLQEGPCITAALQRRTVRSGSPGASTSPPRPIRRTHHGSRKTLSCGPQSSPARSLATRPGSAASASRSLAALFGP